MAKFNFDICCPRTGTGAMKLDCLAELFGNPDLIPLWIADMDFPTAPEIVNALAKRIQHPIYGYTAAPQSFWNAIINWLKKRHDLTVARHELAFVPGVVRGLGYAINFFTRPGDKVVIQPPVYPPFRRITEGNNRIVVENPLRRIEGGLYEMDFENLEHVFATEHPKMLILCNPHNPGGVQWDAGTLRTLASLAKKHNVIVLSDEIHADLMLRGMRHIPFASVSPEAADVAITFGAPSKTFNIPGLVCSWMFIKNPELRTPFFNWMEVNEFSTPTMLAITGAEAAYTCGEPWLAELIEYIDGNITAVEKFFASNLPQIKPLRPHASFVVWLDCRQLGLDADQLARRFTDAGLALNPGHTFGSQGAGYMRLNIAMPRKQLIDALSRLL